jgi:hypothetical protein
MRRLLVTLSVLSALLVGCSEDRVTDPFLELAGDAGSTPMSDDDDNDDGPDSPADAGRPDTGSRPDTGPRTDSGPSSTCTDVPFTAPEGAGCSAEATACVAECTDGTCLNECVNADGNECIQCVNGNIIACYNDIGCKPEFNCWAECLNMECDASGCPEGACAAELGMYQACAQRNDPMGAQCGSSFSVCFPPPGGDEDAGMGSDSAAAVDSGTAAADTGTPDAG